NGNITDYITNNPDITSSDKLRLLCDAARGLVYLHPLVPSGFHGDIKANNVLVKDNFEATLGDLGASKTRARIGKYIPSDRGINPKSSGAGYMAKELLEESLPPLTAAGDVSAFGGLILAAMSGEGPFSRKPNDAARIFAILCLDKILRPADHPLLPERDPLRSLLKACWSADPEARPSM
ncbi:hypothetical protein M407DRAFT_45503, partial [Tulasnella calospora MUT 4182]